MKIVFGFQIFSTFSAKTKQKQRPTATKKKKIEIVLSARARDKIVAGAKVKKKTVCLKYISRSDWILYDTSHVTATHIKCSFRPTHTYVYVYNTYVHIMYNLYCKYILYAPENVINYGAEKKLKTSRRDRSRGTKCYLIIFIIYKK